MTKITSVSFDSLKHGDAITLLIGGNYVSGRVLVHSSWKYVANNDYGSCNYENLHTKRSERFGYRLIHLLGSRTYERNILQVQKKDLADIPYKTRDILENSEGEQVKVLGRVGAVHIISAGDDFDVADCMMTRAELDEEGFSLYVDEEDDTEEEPEEMTLAQICAELGRDVKVVRN